MSETLRSTETRQHMTHWQWFALGFLAAMTVFGASAMLFIHRVPAVPVKVQVEDSGLPANGTVCVGQVKTVRSQITILAPTVLEVLTSVMDANGNGNIPGTQVLSAPRTHPRAGTFIQRLEWRVPPLEPGHYQRVTALMTHGVESEPVFLSVPFTVTTDCPP